MKLSIPRWSFNISIIIPYVVIAKAKGWEERREKVKQKRKSR